MDPRRAKIRPFALGAAVPPICAALVLAGVVMAKGLGGSAEQPVVYGFEGRYRGDQRVKVTDGTKHTEQANLVGKTVRFDMRFSKVDVADTNDDGYQDFRDFIGGDELFIKTELPKRRPGAQPFPARLIVDRSDPAPN